MTQPITVEASGNMTRVTLSGTINLFVAGQLHQVALGLLTAGGRVSVDCRQADHLDGSACQLLLALKRDLRSRGGDLMLAGVPQAVDRYLRLAGMSELITGVTA